MLPKLLLTRPRPMLILERSFGIHKSAVALCLLIGTCLAVAQHVPRHLRSKPVATRKIAKRVVVPLTSPVNGTIQVNLTQANVLNHFQTNKALGVGVDAIGIGGEPTQFSASNISSIVTAGAGGISYRLYTELNVEDWHWNPSGTWSDPANNQGYFVGSSAVKAPIIDSYGFLLLHRGSTFDQGDNLDYSRITDGDSNTYWKSNPYLTSTYTNEPDSMHPQWAILDLGTTQNVNAIKINWSNPYAVSYSVQYWTGDDAIYDPTNGQWVNFPTGVVNTGTGGIVTLKLSSSPISAEFIRVLMTQSSNTFDNDGNDPRNAMGYAIDEIGIGTLDSNSNFTDLVVHSKDQNQTVVYVSSTDPWHTAAAQNDETEQVGLDFIFAGNVSQRLPAMAPVPMVYSNPQNALAEVAYLTRRRYPIQGIELGEEPDGQFMTPEDYGAFYIQWATAIHANFPQYKLGGPVLSNSGVLTWADANGETDWLKRFVAYLSAHNSLSLLSFVSTEHYPFTATTTDWTLLAQEPPQVQSLFDEVSNANLPKGFPFYVTEYNFSSGVSEVPVDLMGALWHAMFVGEFMNRGGLGSFYYQDLPVQLSTDGTYWGILGMFTSDDNDQISGKTAQYFSSQILTQQWCEPGNGTHSVLPATTTIVDANGNPIVVPYVLSRPDGQYSVLLLNTDSVTHTVQVEFSNTSNHYFTGQVAQVQFSAKDYAWIPNGANGAANPAGPYEQSTVSGGSATTYSLPAHSITVLRGKIL